MKKILSIICLFTVVLAAASCKKETIVQPGTQTIFITANNWVTTNGGKTYTADVAVPQIDDHFDNDGTVSIANDLGGGEYEQLPSVFEGITYRSTYTGGHVYIDAQTSDGTGTITPPPALNLKITLIY